MRSSREIQIVGAVVYADACSCPFLTPLGIHARGGSCLHDVRAEESFFGAQPFIFSCSSFTFPSYSMSRSTPSSVSTICSQLRLWRILLAPPRIHARRHGCDTDVRAGELVLRHIQVRSALLVAEGLCRVAQPRVHAQGNIGYPDVRAGELSFNRGVTSFSRSWHIALVCFTSAS